MLDSGNRISSNILVVDDDDDIRATLSELLAADGYPVATAANGRDALEYLHSHDHPCFVLLDMTMPVMSGWEFLKERTRSAHLQRVPVVLMSANMDLLRMDDLKLFDRLTKPFEFEAVKRLAGKYCESRKVTP